MITIWSLCWKIIKKFIGVIATFCNFPYWEARNGSLNWIWALTRPNPIRTYLWPAVNKRPTWLWPGYFLTQPDDFFWPKGQKFDFFPNPYPNQRWLTRPRSKNFDPDSSLRPKPNNLTQMVQPLLATFAVIHFLCTFYKISQTLMDQSCLWWLISNLRVISSFALTLAIPERLTVQKIQRRTLT